MTQRSLSGTHILVVDDDELVRKELQCALEARGAIVHHSSGRTDALGKLVELSVRDQCPRGIVIDWILNPPDSKENQFYRLLGRNERNTSLGLIHNARRMDRSLPIIVWSYFNDSMPKDLARAFGLQVVNKQDHNSLETVVHLLSKDESIQHRRHQSGEFDMSDSERLRLSQAAPEEQDRCAQAATQFLNRHDVAASMATSTMTPAHPVRVLQSSRSLSPRP